MILFFRYNVKTDYFNFHLSTFFLERERVRSQGAFVQAVTPLERNGRLDGEKVSDRLEKRETTFSSVLLLSIFTKEHRMVSNHHRHPTPYPKADGTHPTTLPN